LVTTRVSAGDATGDADAPTIARHNTISNRSASVTVFMGTLLPVSYRPEPAEEPGWIENVLQ
jgi:hypothetical protein